MFAGHRTDDEFHSPAAEMLRILHQAGCNTGDERELLMGAAAYNAALLVCRRTSRKRSVRPMQKARAGRNDPCPCGSGKKYKKCCLDMDRPVSADYGDEIKFGPDALPPLWNGRAMFADLERLSQIIDSDPAFANIGFSPAEIGPFLDTVSESQPALIEALKQDDQETYRRALDELGVRFLREYGDPDIAQSVKDRCLEVAKRATSNSEVRALATGVSMAMLGSVSNDPAADPLAVILFRKALFNAASSVQFIDKILDQFGGKDEVRRLIEANDPSVVEKIKSIADELSPSEVNFLRSDFDRGHRTLWDTVNAGEFPVPPPFATQLALVGRLASVTTAGKLPSKDQMTAILMAFSNELIEEDYVLYSRMLDRWLKEDKERSAHIAEAVKIMWQLCGIRSLGDVAPTLFVRCLDNREWAVFDEDERDLIASLGGARDMPTFIADYGAWLRTKGYPGMAERLVRSWEGADISWVNPRDLERRIA